MSHYLNLFFDKKSCQWFEVSISKVSFRFHFRFLNSANQKLENHFRFLISNFLTNRKWVYLVIDKLFENISKASIVSNWIQSPAFISVIYFVIWHPWVISVVIWHLGHIKNKQWVSPGSALRDRDWSLPWKLK